MSHPVFISYARRTSRGYAEALHVALGEVGVSAFLDTTDLEAEESFPRKIVDALLDARVVVIFADDAYFRSWYCRWEFRAALAPLLALEPVAEESQRRAALASMLIALPPEGSPPIALERLPPQLQMTQWPRADETERLAERVRNQLGVATSRLRERIDTAGGASARLQTFLLEEAALPPPVSLAGFTPLHPLQWPPSLGASFVGRAEELWRIHYTLASLHGDAVGASLTGSALEGGGGFGKTRLALEYLHRLGPRYYRGGLFWVDADVSDDRLEEQFHGILRALRPGEFPDLGTFRELRRDATKELALALHDASGKGPILYVVDNVPEPGPGRARRPIETWCPALGKVALLVTSRLKLLKADNLRALRVDVLAPEPAIALLSEGVQEQVDASSWFRIAEWVGYLPLALELLNRAIDAGSVTPGEIVSKVEQGPVRELDRQMESLREHIAPGSLRGVTEALSISYERLSEPARRAARLLAWLAHEPIPLVLLEALGPDVNSPAVRTALRSRHFIRAAEGAPVPMFGDMHRVLADFLRSQSEDPSEELTQLCEALLAVMTRSACRDARTWPLMNACLPHAEMILAHWAHLGIQAEAQNEIELGQNLQAHLLARGLAARAKSFGEGLIQRSGELLGAEHPETLEAMSYFTVTLCALGALPEARKLQETVLASCERQFGAEDKSTWNAKLGLARILEEQGDPAGAQTILEALLEPMRRDLGPEHEGVLSVLNNLGHLHHVQGRDEEARLLQEQVVEARRRLLGGGHTDTLTAMNNLAMTLYHLDKVSSARALLQEVLELRRQHLGEDHPSTLNTMSNLASILQQEGTLAEARVLAEQSVEGCLRLLGPSHSFTLSAMNRLASILGAQGDRPAERALLERVLEAARRVLGDEHPKTFTVMGNLVGVLIKEGNLQRARGLQKRVLEAHLRLHGNEHSVTTVSAWNYFYIQLGLRNQREARKLLETHLIWLLKRAPESLTEQQRTIRQNVADTIRSRRLS